MTDLDVTKAIQPKSDQLNADSLIVGPRTIRIRDVQINATAEQPIWIFFDGDDNKPWKPCKTAARCLASIWGSNAAQWIGMHCTLYNDPTVTWAGAAVGGIRVSHMEGLDKPRQLNLTKTRGKKGIVTIQPLFIDGADTNQVSAKDAQNAARKAASGGKDAFEAWWKENPPMRVHARAIMDELKDICAKADTPQIPEEYDDEIPM